jgi:hypothetical protein
MLVRLTRETKASAPIAARDILLALMLLGAVQIGAFLIFIVYSVVIFRLWEGGIFFYKSIVAAAVFSLLLFGGLLSISAFPIIDHWLSSASLHRHWFCDIEHHYPILYHCLVHRADSGVDRSIHIDIPVGHYGE